MNNFGNQRKSLKSPGTESFEQEEFRKIVKLALVGNSQDGTQSPKVDIGCSDLMMFGGYQALRFLRRSASATARSIKQGCDGLLLHDIEQSRLCRPRFPIHQIHDLALVFTHDSRMRFGSKVAHGG